MFDFLDVISWQVVFAAKRSGRLPKYLGSTIRGVMGHCFRDFVCNTQDMKCFACEKQKECLYVHHFSNTGGMGGAINPFVLYPHNQGKTEWVEGDECIFDLTLFGHASANPSIYMDAILQMERRGWGVEKIPFALKRITDLESGQLIFFSGKTWLRNISSHTMKTRKVEARTALVVFDTPARIVSGKKLLTELPFQDLMRFLMGRFSLLTQVCTDFSMEWNQKDMLKQAASVNIAAQEWRKIDFTRYSMNQKDGKLELPSFIGSVLYEGNLTPFVPYLEAGRYFHIGKSTTIGFGHYDIYYDGEV